MAIVEIPEGVTVAIEGNRLMVTGPKGSLNRALGTVRAKLTDGGVEIEARSKKRTDEAMVGTYVAHLRNMITGVTEGFVYELKVVYAHFPIKVSSSSDEKVVLIHNFLGERKPRTARIMGDATKVEVHDGTVKVYGIDPEAVGQTAANIETATRIKHRDPRVFQDGIYLTRRSW